MQAYFQAINDRDFQRAWDLGGRNLGSTYATFVNGFANTAHDDLTSITATGQSVSVQFTAMNSDGTQQQFAGTYTVAGGIVTAAQISAVATAPVLPIPAQQADLCGAPPNPYGYNYCGRGKDITNPPGDICSYFTCIQNFPNGRGFMEECRDGTVSKSGGISGSCSRHAGDLRPVTG